MSRIYFQERPDARLQEPCDRTIPFWKGGGHRTHAEAVPPAAHEDAYEKIYHPLVGWLKKESRRGLCVYRDTDVLWCFKYLLFIHAHYAFLLHEAFEKSFSFSDGDEVVLEDAGPSLSEARLSEILEFSEWKAELRIRKIHPEPAVSAPKSKVAIKELVWPRKISRGNVAGKRVALFADLFKFDKLIGELGPGNVCVYATARSPRVFLQSLRRGTGFYQCAPPAAYAPHPETARLVGAFETAAAGFDLKLGKMNIGGFCAARLRRLAATHLNALLHQIDETHLFFKASPALKSALLDEDISFQKNVFCQIAPQYRVRTYVKAHGALSGKIGFLPLTADQVFVWGNASAKKIQAWGCEPEKIVVTGCSWHETYAGLDRSVVRQRVLGELGLDASKPTVVVALHARQVLCFVYGEIIERTIDWILDVVARRKDVQFIVKLHHGEPNIDYYRQWAQRSGVSGRVVVTQTHNPYLLALACDAAVSHHSTYAVDAFALGTPVVCVKDDYLVPCVTEFEKFGIFKAVDHPGDFEKALERALKTSPAEPNRKTILRECLNIGPGIPSATRLIASRLLARNGGS